MHLIEIHLKDENKSSTVCRAAHLSPAYGIEGNAPSKRERQVSLLAGELLPGLRDIGGLCTGKFDANFLTEGLDYSRLSPGTRLFIGGAALEITSAGKRCFDECPLRQRGERCPLPDNCAFARVAAEGDVAAGNEITLAE